MAFEHNPDKGSIFRNDRKEKESQPDHKGDARLKCPHCNKIFDTWISAWVNDLKTKTGKYFSLAFTPKEEQPDAAAVPSTPAAQGDFDDDIPF